MLELLYIVLGLSRVVAISCSLRWLARVCWRGHLLLLSHLHEQVLFDDLDVGELFRHLPDQFVVDLLVARHRA